MLKVKPVKKKIFRRILISLLTLIFLAAFSLIWAFKIEPHLLRLKTYQISSTELPTHWQGRKIGFLTDIHAGPGFGSKQLAKAVDRMLAMEPDIIFYGGDLVDSATPIDDEQFAENIIAELSRLEAPLGKYAVVGNHDNRLRHELDAAVSWLEQSGFTLLINQAVTIDGIWLGGLDESYFGNPDLELTMGYPDETTAYGSADENSLYRIMLMHQPDYLPDFEKFEGKDSLDLILSGHSHNGQITLFGKPLMKVYQGSNYTHGQYQPFENSSGQLIVSGGLGTVLIHARIFNPPEIVIIELNRD